MLADLLTFKGYQAVTAASGAEALAKIEAEHPDLVLLDVDDARHERLRGLPNIRANPAHRHAAGGAWSPRSIPAQERVKGIEAGADDFLYEAHQPDRAAGARALAAAHQGSSRTTVQSQAEQLADWNRKLEQRVQEQVAQLDRLGRLKRFFSPQLAESIVDGGEDLLKTHRREVVVVFLDLRGFTAFTDRAEPEEVMSVLAQYHQAMGELVVANEGTLERFAGDAMMVFFNDPIRLANPAENAVRMAVAMRAKFGSLRAAWKRSGYDLDLGIGIAQGYATLGTIGFEGRWDYACIGSVSNVASRLCSEAKGGQILINEKSLLGIEGSVSAEPLGEVTLKGISHPVAAFNVTGFK